ncbi:MAG: mechanosensitive ion channel [Desulfoarculaceae bacterium]|nr:mechanosensitive ion channel [Desulfoarculaceae bacterium]
MRSFYLFLLSLLFPLFCSLSLAHAEDLPDIPVAIETQLYQGTVEEVTAFIGKRQAQVEGLITLITTDMQKGKAENGKIVFTTLLDLFQGLSFQLKNLQAELVRSELPPMQIPSPGSPPYKLDVFDEMMSFQQKAVLQLGMYEENLGYGEARIASLKDELTILLPLYVQVKSEDSSRMQAYEQLAYILNLQHEYAILQLKRPRLNKALTEVRVVVKEASAQAEKVFGQLQIGKEDIAELKKKVDLLNESHAASLAKLNAENLDLNKQSVVAESKLDKAITAITSKAKGDTAVAVLEDEKQRLELVLEAIRLRQKSIIQKKMNLGLALQGMMFRQEWLTAYVEMNDGEKPSAFIEQWRKKSAELIAQKETLVQDLSLATQKRADLTQRLVSITSKVGPDGNQELQTIFAKQAEKTMGNLDAFIIGITNNVHDLNQLRDETALVLQLLLNRMDRGERFLSWGLAYVTDKWEQSRAVLYYPLVTIGETSITLITIFKVIVLLLVGVRILNVIRRKTACLLTERTAMTPGAVHSMTTLVYYAAFVLGLLIILSTIGFNVSQLGIIFGALSVGVGFGLQTIANNFVSGIILLTEQPIQVGDYVELEAGITGEVKKISIRATIVRTFDGEDVIVPNSELVSSRVNTWSYEDNWRRLKIPFGVSYDSDPAEVARLAEEAAREVKVTKEDAAHPLRVFFEGFGDNSLDFSIRPWCWMNQINAQTGMISDYYFSLFKKFKDAGIKIPFPQTDLHLKSISPEVLAILQQKAAVSGQSGSGESGHDGGEHKVL